MSDWDDVRRLALALPGTEERTSRDGSPSWRVRDKLFAWDRPLRRADFDALGAAAPEGPILAVRVLDVGVKPALIATSPELYFTTPHFDGYPAILVRLERIGADELEELLVEGWMTRAPRRMVAGYLTEP